MEREFPFPPYPNGWFAVAYGDEIAECELRSLEYFGKPLVLYRGEDSVARVIDAHCPHLGAHIGFGGKVEGDGVRCPFHAWRFGADGRCVEIPYAKRIPPQAKIGTWATCERNEMVYVWHHAEGKPPDKQIAAIDEYDSEGWGDTTRVRWRVKSRMYDMGENAVDAQHFRFLHGGVAPDFRQAEAEQGRSRNVSNLDMPTPQGEVKGSITSEFFGPGVGIVHVRGVLHTIIVMATTPIDDQTVDVRFNYLQPRSDDPKRQRLGRAMVDELKRQMDQDIVIFENKKYLTEPLLLPEDGPIAEYRRRARRDYTGEFY